MKHGTSSSTCRIASNNFHASTRSGSKPAEAAKTAENSVKTTNLGDNVPTADDEATGEKAKQVSQGWCPRRLRKKPASTVPLVPRAKQSSEQTTEKWHTK